MNPDARTSDGSSLQTIEKVRDARLLPVADCSPKLARSSRASRTTTALVVREALEDRARFGEQSATGNRRASRTFSIVCNEDPSDVRASGFIRSPRLHRRRILATGRSENYRSDRRPRLFTRAEIERVASGAHEQILSTFCGRTEYSIGPCILWKQLRN